MRTLVADDEAIARQRMIRLLSEIEGITVVGECQNVDEVLSRVRGGGVELLLLDVQMPGLTGIDAMALLPDDGPDVVLCTAHAEYAVKAFEEGAADYLLKPVELDRLKKAVERVRARRALLDTAPANRKLPDGFSRLPVPTRAGVVLIDPKAISHAVLDGVLVTIVTSHGEYVTDAALGELERKLPETFLRVHRKALVNLEQVVRLEPIETGGYLAHMAGGRQVEVSRQSARDLRKWLGLRKGPEE
jgi:two-component system LytT family response regulator